MSGRIFRGIISTLTGIDDTSDADTDDGVDLDGVDYEEGDLIIDADDLYQIGIDNKYHLESMYNEWTNLSDDVRDSTDPEDHARGWLERNLKNVSDNTIVTLIGIFGGIILGGAMGDKIDFERTLSKIAGK